MQGETLILYLAVSEAAVSSVLIRLENNVELPVFYVSRALLDPETRYPEAEKVALALMMAARKLRPYFQAHAILVYTKAPLRQILQSPECSGRLAKWAIELKLNSVLSPWPFAKWGIDLIGPLPLGKYRMKFAVVAIDYYTKWVEAEPLSEITEARTTSFVWKNIVCRFGIPHSLVSDNGTQFDSTGLKKLCSELGIRKHFASVAHPQSNG
ncbi:hypothetical protein UlMin_042392 [Ulmus minor]